MDFDIDKLTQFFQFMDERHRIYIRYKVEGQPWPWTDDPILQEYSFTNIFRELDTGTIWLRENWREPYADHERLFFNICLYRQFNWWPTADFLGFMTRDTPPYGHAGVWHPETVIDDLRYRRENGETHDERKLFTGAYMQTGTIAGNNGQDKIWQTVVMVLDPIWREPSKYEPEPGSTLQEAFMRLQKAVGFGAFTAYEVISDLRWTRYLEDAPDIYTWANPGPGAMRGINRLYNVPVGVIPNNEPGKNRTRKHYKVKVKPTEDYIQDMRDLLKLAYVELGDHIPRDENFDMRMIEHSLCEWDKYMRILMQQGTVRNKYRPPETS